MVCCRVRPVHENESMDLVLDEANPNTVVVRDPRGGRARAWREATSSSEGVVGRRGSISSTDVESSVFTFDGIYGPQMTTGEVFADRAVGLANDVTEGLASTIIAYGQTGSGKTHTMGTTTGEGITPCAIAFFARMKHELESNEAKVESMEVQATFVEIYDDCAYDLLATTPVDQTPPLNVRNNEIQNATVVRGTGCDLRNIVREFGRGQGRRTTGSTAANERSSRSHSIFTLRVITQRADARYNASLTLVDLAGSERNCDSLATGERFDEAKGINLSLTYLGSVVKSLSKGEQATFGNCTLTRVLRFALSGNSRTLLIATVNPSLAHADPTRSTLLFAQRVKDIKTKPSVVKEVTVQQLQMELDAMRRDMAELRESSASCDRCDETGLALALANEEIKALNTTLARERDSASSERYDLMQQLDTTRHELSIAVDSATEAASIAQTDFQRLRTECESRLASADARMLAATIDHSHKTELLESAVTDARTERDNVIRDLEAARAEVEGLRRAAEAKSVPIPPPPPIGRPQPPPLSVSTSLVLSAHAPPFVPAVGSAASAATPAAVATSASAAGMLARASQPRDGRPVDAQLAEVSKAWSSEVDAAAQWMVATGGRDPPSPPPSRVAPIPDTAASASQTAESAGARTAAVRARLMSSVVRAATYSEGNQLLQVESPEQSRARIAREAAMQAEMERLKGVVATLRASAEASRHEIRDLEALVRKTNDRSIAIVREQNASTQVTIQALRDTIAARDVEITRLSHDAVEATSRMQTMEASLRASQGIRGLNALRSAGISIGVSGATAVVEDEDQARMDALVRDAYEWQRLAEKRAYVIRNLRVQLARQNASAVDIMAALDDRPD